MRLCVALAAFLLSADARAAERDETLAAAAERYFAAENLYNGLYIGIGSSNAAIGAVLATRADAGLRAAGYPLIAVGGIELIVGIVYLGLTPGWRREAFAALDRGRGEFLEKQRARLAAIEKNFLYYELVDGAAAAAGLTLGVVGAARRQEALAGAGAGLGAVAFAQLTMDLITHEVAASYLRALDRAAAQPTARIRPGPGGISFAVTF
jgi:hypothetical protein